MITSLLFYISLSFAISPRAIYENNKGVDQIAKGDKVAPTYFNRLIQDNPEEWVFYWNQIVSNIQSEDFDTAAQTLKWLSTIVPAEDVGLRFYIYYQLGRVYAEQKKQSDALDAYQKALDIYPDSKEVTINIELLIQGGGGGGGGESEEKDKDKKEQQQDQGQDNKPKEDQPNKDEKGPKPTPKPFDSKDLSKEDVKRILDELKRQEEKIRAKIDDSKHKEKGLGKDW